MVVLVLLGGLFVLTQGKRTCTFYLHNLLNVMANILGISAFYHDSAAALLQQGVVTAAAQEERFTRVKHDPSFPSNSIDFVLKQAGLQISNIDYIAFYEKPFLKFGASGNLLAFSPRGFRSFSKAMPIWIRDKLFRKINS